MGEGPFITGVPITDDLVFFYPGYDFHGMIIPVRSVALELYRQHLAATKEMWNLHFSEDSNVN